MNFKLKISIVLHVFCTLFKLVSSTKQFKVAVVEYNRGDQLINNPIDINQKLILRAQDHINLLESINEDLEIILYPEKSLFFDNYSLSDVSATLPKNFNQIICNSTDPSFKEFLKLFSCASIKFNTSIAINVIEEENCSSRELCENSDPVYYNTMVIFDNKGYISGRYRKWNLFGEYPTSRPKEVDITVIKTKNDVTFGAFICFDINFDTPALNLTRDLKIRNILFPSNWISELPYLTALQVQQMWAHENNVTLLSAGANNPKTGGSGSGIFLGAQGPLESVFIGEPGGTKVIVQTISNLDIEETSLPYIPPNDEDVDTLAKSLDDFLIWRDLSMDDHTSLLLNESQSKIIAEVCNGDDIKICCQFEIDIKVNETEKNTNKYHYKYHLAAFNGIRSFSGLRNAGIEVCGVVACLNESLSSCGRRFSNYSEISWPITFERVTVEANFTIDEKRIQYPNSLLSSIKPIHPMYTSWEKQELSDSVKRKHVLNKPENRLLTFGIYGRDFRRDSPLKTSSTSSITVSQSSIILLLISLISFFNV